MNPGTVMQTGQKQHWLLDQHRSWRPSYDHEADVKRDDMAMRRAALCCIRCLHPITEHTESMDLAGGHTHVFTNPSGYTYELALYSHADCLIHGPATTEYTWFAGYAWQLALCANCHEHLGWHYRRPGSATFYGLIRDRLREVNA